MVAYCIMVYNPIESNVLRFLKLRMPSGGATRRNTITPSADLGNGGDT